MDKCKLDIAKSVTLEVLKTGVIKPFGDNVETARLEYAKEVINLLCNIIVDLRI